MKFNELTDLIDKVIAKNSLEEDKTFLKFASAAELSGEVDYIPSKYAHGQGYDPPEAFAKTYKWERTVDFDFSIYAAEKKPGKLVLKVSDSEFDGDIEPGGIPFDGIIYSDDSSKASLKALPKMLGLDGNEEVFLSYNGKEAKLVEPDLRGILKDIFCEKNVYGSYSNVLINDDGVFEDSMSQAWKDWKAAEIAETIDAEAEVRELKRYYSDLDRED